MKKIKIFLYTALLCLIVSTSVHAILIDQGNGLIYDDMLNVTWLQDINYARTWITDSWVNDKIGEVVDGHVISINDFHRLADGTYLGSFSWWAAHLFVEDLDYQGYTDWRLPTTPGINVGRVNEGEC